jgi:hypothetical protein
MCVCAQTRKKQRLIEGVSNKLTRSSDSHFPSCKNSCKPSNRVPDNEMFPLLCNLRFITVAIKAGATIVQYTSSAVFIRRKHTAKMKLSHVTPWGRIGEWRYCSTTLNLSTRWSWELGGPMSWSEHYGEEKNLLSLLMVHEYWNEYENGMRVCGLDPPGSGQDSLVGCCEYGNDPSGYIRG